MIRACADFDVGQQLVCCPKKDCGITAKFFASGTFELSHEFCYLLAITQ